MQKRNHRKDNEFDKTVCAFCALPPDEKNFGTFFTSKFGFSVHKYCMFFSAGLPQNGEDEEGFEGFLEQDVLKEVRRAGRLKCCMCGKKGASTGCCSHHCRKGFHYPCGVNHKYLFQFFGQFRAYCFDHRLHQNTKSYLSKKVPCPICLELVQCRSSPDVLTTPCCKDEWFHKSCIQEQALVSGYFFRCPVCNDTEKFVEEMKTMGIYVPDRDAAWEDGNNFAELLEKYNTCDYSACRCPMGRQYSTDKGKWEMILCSSCGQFGTHVGCTSWPTNPPYLLCPACLPAHESSQPHTASATEAVKFNQGGAKTRSLAATKPGLLGKSTTNARKDGQKCDRAETRPRKKLQHVDSDTDCDDISNVVDDLRRKAEGNFLNSDTSFRLERAFAAGDAAIHHGEAMKSRDNQSAAAPISSGSNSYRKRKADDAGSDDEIMITKYVPAQKRPFEICPKCNRLIKRIGAGTSAKLPRKSFPSLGTSCSVGKKSGSTSTMTKADMEKKTATNVAPVSKRGTLNTRTGQFDRETRDVTVADYEVLELAAEHTDKFSVLLLSSENRQNGMVGSLKEGNINKDDGPDGGRGGNERKKETPAAPKSTSWLKSIFPPFSFFNPLSATETSRKEEIRELSLTNYSAGFNKDGSPLARGITALNNTEKSDGDVDVTIWLKSSEGQSGTTEERSVSVGRISKATEGISTILRNNPINIENGSDFVADTNSKQTIDFNANSSTFFDLTSNSGQDNNFEFLKKKAVLAEVIDHAKELMNSS